MSSAPQGQDWTPVTIKRSMNYAAAATAATTASSAQGTPRIPTGTRTASGTHIHYNDDSAAARKAEAADTPIKLKQLATESRHLIVTLRATNKWTQVELNRRCNFPVNTIRDIETGKTCPSPGQLGILNRVLKTGLKYA